MVDDVITENRRKPFNEPSMRKHPQPSELAQPVGSSNARTDPTIGQSDCASLPGPGGIPMSESKAVVEDQQTTLFSVVRPISFYQSDDVASTDGLTYEEARQLANRYRRNGLDVCIQEYEV